MKKVLQINILNETGSTGRIVQSISTLLQKKGYESFTAYGYGYSYKKNAYKIGTKIEYYFHSFFSRLTGLQGKFSVLATLRFIGYIKKIKPDIIHLHNIHGNYLNYPILFRYIKKNEVKVIWTLHDCWAFTGKCVHFEKSNCFKWKSECNNCPNLDDYPCSFYFDKSKKEYKNKKKWFTGLSNMIIVTPSEWLGNYVKMSFLKDYPIKIINNGINLDNFIINKKITNVLIPSLRNKKIILGVASPWTESKGLFDFVKLSKIIDDDYKIVLIGINKKQKKSLPDNIYAIEKTEDITELVNWYSIATVFVNMTYEDNFPTVNLEALACNTPIITYNTGGSIEVINSKTGKICHQGDIDTVYNNIKEIAYDYENYICTRKFIEENFDEKKKYEEYIQLYEKLLNEDIIC